MSSRWSVVRAAFEELLEQGDEERTARLDALEGTDPELARELRELLAHDGAGGRFLERSSAPLARPGPRAMLQPGQRLGRYRLERLLGAGGMGAVWEAAQESPARRVALKVLAVEGWSRAERWRFEHEAEVLARLSHPAIAQLYEVGSEPHGGAEVSWFAMELVEDASDIVSWVEQHSLGRSQRLVLFTELCAAVQYGHQRGVIHRDIKPANVLVDRHGRLKLIDFGVARAVSGSNATPSLRTRTGELVGTLQYMAPEQAAGNAHSIDVRCDVYALGVLLYRLLCGTGPFDFEGASLPEVVRIVREEDPRPPSERDPTLSGDLEWILLKALEKEPARRYGGVAELAEDLRRHAADEMVLARAPGRAYRSLKFVRRNRVLVAITGAVVLGLAIATAGALIGLRKARAGETAAIVAGEETRVQERIARQQATLAEEQRQLAAREAQRQRSALGLVEDLFAGIRDTVEGRDVRVADLLESATLDPDTDPDVEFFVRTVRGKIYLRLKLFAEADRELSRAVELFPATTGEASLRERLIESRALLGSAWTRLGRAEEGEALMRAAVEEAQAAGHAQVRTVAELQLLDHLRKRGAFAELMERAQALRERARESGDEPRILLTGELLGFALQGLGRDAEALPLFEEQWESCRARAGERDPRSVGALFNYATALQSAGEAARAEELFPKVVELCSEVLGPVHTQTLTAMNNHAVLALARGDRGAAALRFEAVVRAYDEQGAPPTLEHLIAINNLGMTLFKSSRFGEAEPVLRRGAESAGRILSERDVHRFQFGFNHGACLAAMKRWEEARPVLFENMAALEALLPAGNPILAMARRTIADALQLNGLPDEAARWRGGR